MFKRKCRWFRMALVVPLMVALPLQSAWSLGLSEIEVDSALNEKFSATIDLIDLGDLSKDEIVVSMASREDFDRVGVERFFYLTDLKFEVDLKGTAKVVISSSRLISEPYLNFIVQIMWPKGRLLKEFTVLLDPPTFTETSAAPISAPAPIASRPSSQSSTASASNPDQVSLRRTPRSNRMVADADGEIVSTRDDTLWKIAGRTRGSIVSMNQQMLALQELNPRAFIRDNINLLKAGYRLKVPSEAQALALSQGEATAEVRQQAASWRNPGQESLAQAPSASDDGPSLRSQVDGTSVQTASNSSTDSAQGQVRIVANSGELSQGTVAGGVEVDAQLLEEKATLSRQVEELTYQLDREKELAESQVALKERQLEVKDQALAQLQERVAQLEKAQANDGQQQNQTATPANIEVPWWQSPLFLGGVIGVLVLLLAWAMVGARRREDEEVQDYGRIDYDENEAEYEDEVAVEPIVGAVDEDSLEAEQALDEAEHEFDDPNSEKGSEKNSEKDLQDDQKAAFDGVESGGDVVAEADIYMAYGRYGQAVSLLLNTLRKEPARHDVRLKLLEVCVEAEDPNQFSEHAEYLVENCNDEDILLACRDLEGRLSDQVSVLDELQGDESKEASSPAEGGADELLTSDELDDAIDEVGAEDASSFSGSESESEDGIDFELEFDGEDVQADSNDTMSEDLSGDLGLDFDADSSENETSAAGSDDLDTGLDFELDLDSKESEPTVELSDDFDLDNLELDEESDTSNRGASEENPDENPTENEKPIENNDGFDDFDFETDGDADVNTTKLDLAEAYIDMGDGDGARDILREVIEEGSAEQISKAQSLIDSIA